jgi:hypothetical protein
VQDGTAGRACERRRPFCADLSRTREEPLGATASRIDHWLLVEYRGAWRRDILGGSLLSPRLKAHLREHLELLRPARLLFVKQPERRAESGRRVFLASTTPAPSGCSVSRSSTRTTSATSTWPARSRRRGAVHPVADPVLVVCTHGKRDRCCARYGGPLYDALRAAAPPGEVWQSTHVGGDRFAGNVVALPQGTFHGGSSRRRPGAPTRACQGRVDLDRYRGRSAYPFAVQAAERALRETEGLLGLDDLVLLGSERSGDDAWRVRFRTPDGATHRLDVVAELGEPELLTCEAAEPRHRAASAWPRTAHPRPLRP